MKAKRLLLSGVSILVVLCLMVGGTMAWFTDTEKVSANFSAGVLDITVTPGAGASKPLTFQNLRPMEFEAFKAEINALGNGNNHTEGYAPAPQYFQPVVIKNAGTLPVYIEISTEKVTPEECPGGGEEKITLGEKGNPGKVAWDSNGKDGSCTNKLYDVLKLVLFEKVNGQWTVVADNLNPGSEGKPYTPSLVIPAAKGAQEYVIGAYLPGETVDNEYQGKHFHGNLVVKAFQTDEGAGAADMAVVQWVKDGKVVGSYRVAFQQGEETMTLKPDASKLVAGYELVDPDATVEVSKTHKTASFEVKFSEDGDGSSFEQAIWVRSAEELDNIRNGLDKFYKLGADVDLSNYDWEPIGPELDNFTGALDGNGYCITGLKAGQEERPKALKYAGLFGYCSGAELKNLTIKAPQVKTGEFGGALAGCVSDTRVENCTVNGGNIVWDDEGGSCYLGGLVGDMIGETSLLKDCTVSADVTAVGNAKSSVYVGGLTGELYFGTINGCTVTGDVKMTGSTKNTKTIAVGGLAGWLIGTASDSSVKGDVENQSTGTAGKIYVGGLAGMFNGSANGCTASGNVANSGAAGEIYEGQLAGKMIEE